MSGQKRSFPYHSAVPEISLKRRGVEALNPGLESHSAEVFEVPELDDLEPSDTVSEAISSAIGGCLHKFLESKPVVISAGCIRLLEVERQ